MIYACECGRKLPIDQPAKFRCACGRSGVVFGTVSRADAAQDRSARWSVSCIHRGDTIGVADCDCHTKPTVYVCGIHGICVPRMKTTAALAILHDGTRATVSKVCQRCDDHVPDDGRTYRDSIRIVTSFSPRRTERQLACLASWRRLGMPIVAVQPSHEIDAMAEIYEGVEWVPREGQRPTIAELASVASDGPILLINSDIEIQSTQSEFRRDWLAIEGNTFRVGCRWEIAVGRRPHLQRWGIDAFLITTEMLADFRDLGFRIGQPVWDYCIVLHYSSLGYTIRAKTDRGLAHESHQPAWTKAQGREGVAIIAREYGIDRETQNRRISELTGRR